MTCRLLFPGLVGFLAGVVPGFSFPNFGIVRCAVRLPSGSCRHELCRVGGVGSAAPGPGAPDRLPSPSPEHTHGFCLIKSKQI